MAKGTLQRSLELMRYERRRRRGNQSSDLERDLAINLSIPKNVEVPLVNATFPADYEAWLFFAALLANAVVGFLVAGITNKNISSIAITVVFSIMFGIAFGMAFSKRRLLRAKKKSFTLRSR